MSKAAATGSPAESATIATLIDGVRDVDGFVFVRWLQPLQKDHDMNHSCIRYRVLVLGLRRQEFSRLRQKAVELNVPVDLRYGGHLEDGSNCVQRALRASGSADVVLLRVNGFPHLPSGFWKDHTVVPVNSVTDALRALVELARQAANVERKRA